MYVRPISTRLLSGMLTPAMRAIVPLTLTLLVPWVLADHEHAPVATDDLALLAHRLDRRSYLHGPFRLMIQTGGRWRQWWLLFERNDHDRGIVRTGRHAGDWELVQVREDARGRPVEAVYSQHAGAERCPWSAVRQRGGRPLVYLARGSHAAYFRPGVRDRTWPDPNDEADGRGAAVTPPVERVSARTPAWMRWPGPWGGAQAGWVPGEQSSPRG